MFYSSQQVVMPTYIDPSVQGSQVEPGQQCKVAGQRRLSDSAHQHTGYPPLGNPGADPFYGLGRDPREAPSVNEDGYYQPQEHLRSRTTQPEYTRSQTPLPCQPSATSHPAAQSINRSSQSAVIPDWALESPQDTQARQPSSAVRRSNSNVQPASRHSDPSIQPNSNRSRADPEEPHSDGRTHRKKSLLSEFISLFQPKPSKKDRLKRGSTALLPTTGSEASASFVEEPPRVESSRPTHPPTGPAGQNYLPHQQLPPQAQIQHPQQMPLQMQMAAPQPPQFQYPAPQGVFPVYAAQPPMYLQPQPMGFPAPVTMQYPGYPGYAQGSQVMQWSPGQQGIIYNTM